MAGAVDFRPGFDKGFGAVGVGGWVDVSKGCGGHFGLDGMFA